MLNKRGKNVQSSLILDLKGKVFTLSSISTVLVMGFHRCPLSDCGSITLFLVIKCFNQEEVLDFAKCFSEAVEMIM